MRVKQSGGTVGGMAKRGGQAPFPGGVQNSFKKAQLLPGKGAPLFFIGRGEVGEEPFKAEPGEMRKAG